MSLWELLRRFIDSAPTTADPAAPTQAAETGFTVLLAPITGDDGTLGRTLTEGLSSVPGLTVRAIASPGVIDPAELPPVSLARMTKRARALADHAEAHCVLVGAVRGRMLDLWVVPAEPYSEPPGCAVLAGEGVSLPVPLGPAMPLAIVATLVALPLDTDAQRAQRMDRLRGPVGELERILQGGQPVLDEAARLSAALCHAAALAEMGWRAGQRPLLDKAADIQQAALAKGRPPPAPAPVAADGAGPGPDDAPPEPSAAAPPALLHPGQVAAAQARLGDLLADIGGRDKDPDRLQRAVGLYRKAAAFYLFELLPEEHARVVAQSGRACHRLASLTGKSTWMREAVTAYRDACRAWTKGAEPERWAEMQNGIGTLLGQLGEFTGNKDIFARAVLVLTGVMDVWTREGQPRRWAGLHNNIGACRFAEGKLNGETPPLRDALEHFAHALEVYEQHKMTRNIHVTQKNIARVERLIAVQEAKD